MQRSIHPLRGPWVSEETVAYVSKQNKRSAHNSRVRIMSLWLQVVYLVQSNSKFTYRVTETMLIIGLHNRTVKGTVTKSCLCKWTERVMGARFCLVFRRINYIFSFWKGITGLRVA